MLDNGGPPLDDEAPKLRWVRVNITELLERMDGMPYDEREGAKLLRCDPRFYRRMRDQLISGGKLHVDGDTLRNIRVDRLIAEYVREHKRRRDAALKRHEREREGHYNAGHVADEMRETSAELPGDFSQTSPELLPEVADTSRRAGCKNPTKSTCAPPRHCPNSTAPTNQEPITNNQEREEVPPLSPQGGAPALIEQGAWPDPQPAGKRKVTQADALACFEAWNALALRLGLPQSRTLTPQWSKQLIARLNEHGGVEAWTLALANVERSAFLQGKTKTDSNWRASFPFMLQASSFAKVVDGVYGNGAHAEPEKPKQPAPEMAPWLRDALERVRRNGY
jgi:hypothetical protein